MSSNLRFLFVGDIIGPAGLAVFLKHLPELKDKYSLDSIVVNGENSAKSGRGITEKIVHKLVAAGVDTITSGNHIWVNREIYDFLNRTDKLIRPANFPTECPGHGYAIYQVNGKFVAVMNLQGRGFMRETIDCPFKKAESLLTFLKTKTNTIFVDFHAETTAEKQALANFLDGKISGFFGTHTHVQTADERILPKGTAYITDLGCCGSIDSVIGMEKEVIINKFVTQLPAKFVPASIPPFAIDGVIVDIESISGFAVKIERIKIIDNSAIE